MNASRSPLQKGNFEKKRYIKFDLNEKRFFDQKWIAPSNLLYPVVADINKIGNITKYSTGKNWPAHQIQHIIISRIHCSDVRFWLFKGGFSLFENWKVGLKGEILEQNWVVKTKKFLLHVKVQPRILIHTQNFCPMTSS